MQRADTGVPVYLWMQDGALRLNNRFHRLTRGDGVMSVTFD